MKYHQQPVTSQLIKSYDEQVQQNPKALLWPSLMLLQYHNWDKQCRREDGNFSLLIDLLSKYFDLDLHLKTSPRNTKYSSPTIQNEFISCKAKYLTPCTSVPDIRNFMSILKELTL